MSELSEKEFKIKVRQRGVVRSVVTEELTKIETVFASTPVNVEAAEVILMQLQTFQEHLKEYDEVLLANTSDDKLDAEIERAGQYRFDITSGLAKIQSRLKALQFVPPSSSNPSPVSNDAAPRLPKLEIPKYNGDPLLWDEFWDNFSSSIHERSELPTIDKFRYLKTFLEGEALQLVEGYRLTVVNYNEVVQALKERFGDPELATFSHFDALICLKQASYNLPELRAVLDKCKSQIRSLVALTLPETTFGVVFTPLILSKLPKGVKIETHRKNGSQPWRLANLGSLLKEEIAAREKGERVFAAAREPAMAKESKSKPKFNPKIHPGRQMTTSSLATPADVTKKSATTSCIFCAGSHFSSNCKSFADFDSRLRQAKGRCHCCLRTGHTAPQCRSKRPCFFCRKDTHHQSLCRKQFGNTVQEQDDSMLATTAPRKPVSGAIATIEKEESNLSIQTPNCESILQTAQTKIKGATRELKVRLYFDTGGSRSFISTSAAQKIGAKCVGEETVSIGRFRDTRRSSVTYQIFEFEICFPNGKSKSVRMSSGRGISCPIQLIPLDPRCPIISQVKLAEPLVKKPITAIIDILVGKDCYYDFIGNDQLRCPSGVVLLSSPFGFIAGGSVNRNVKSRHYDSSFLIHSSKETDSANTLERFWRLEDLGIKDYESQCDDERALEFFNKSVRQHEGRYMVKWPWKDEHPEIPDNYALSLGRLKSLGVVHYIPNHCVVNPAKKTTQLRIVYDASAKSSKDQSSVNECLHRGPVFLVDAVGLIMRWRLPNIAMDLRKPVIKQNIELLRFCRVPFGFISSPFLLAATILHHLNTHKGAVAAEIAKNVYADNVFGGATTTSGALSYYKEAKALLSEASMNLREWYSNSNDFLRSIPENDRGEGQLTSVLGLQWNLSSYQFHIPVGRPPVRTINWSKRLVLQVIASIFDPSGFFCLVTIKGKLLMQVLWKSKIGWDDWLPEPVNALWLVFLPDVVAIPTVKLPRQMKRITNNDGDGFELHCFCDASSKAYAVAVYLRAPSLDYARSDLVFSKSRVAPIKKLTIPRLEPIAVLIGVRCLKFVADQLHLPLTQKYLWSDSSCVLHWICKDLVSTVFVQNRIREIRSHLDIKFRFGPSGDNSAKAQQGNYV